MGLREHIVVGIRVDALVLAEPRMVVEGALDFSRLPFFDGQRDVNSGVPYLSDAVGTRPFQDLNVELPAGVHLHWTLPWAWRSGEHDAEGVTYPAVPDRWLVTRTTDGGMQTAWVVESDYLHPEGNVARPHHVAFPVVPDPDAGRHQPFRHLGRAVPLETWSPLDPAAEYLGDLTAVGYGDPTFSAFYPSCRGIFGFHDPEVPPPGATYQVHGWYSDPRLDLARHHRQQLRTQLGRPPNADELADSFADHLRLRLRRDDGGAVPEHTVLVGGLSVPPETTDEDLPAFPSAILAPSAAEAFAHNLAGHVTTSAEPLDRTEERLDHILLGSAVDHTHVDSGWKFRELCHQLGFVGASGGSVWQLVPDDDSQKPADAAVARDRPPVPDSTAEHLDTLNAIQRERNQVDQAMQSVGSQIFSDWQKWMESQYSLEVSSGVLPDPDRILDHIQRQDLAEHAGLVRERDRLDGRIRTALHDGHRGLVGSGHAITITGAPRYWAPAEPYVLLDGPAVAPGVRFGRPTDDAALDCPIIGAPPADPRGLRAAIAELDWTFLAPVSATGEFGDGWHPILLDWEAEFFELAEGPPPAGGGRADRASYPRDFLSDTHAYGDTDVDLRRRPGSQSAAQPDLLTGRSLLAPGAVTPAISALERFIWRHLIRAEFWAPEQPPPESTRSAYLTEHLPDLIRQYQSDDEHQVLLIALSSLAAAQQATVMGQVLSGFNAGMLMHRQASQLPVADPLGFKEYRAFTDDVVQAVGSTGRFSPIAESGFHPIRAGDLSLVRLRLIDTFGRHIDSGEEVADTVELSRQLKRNPGRPDLAHLPARLSQPARIAANWLSATHDLLESSDHPLTSPVCGWFLANHLDRTLMVYEASGKLAGSLVEGPDTLDATQSRWITAPGGGGRAHPEMLENDHLRAVVARLRALGPQGLGIHLDRIDHTLEMIEPHAATDHSDTALLMGQPFALVRAQIDLQVLGRPAIDQGWLALEVAMSRASDDPDITASVTHAHRGDRGLGDVAVRVRLGDLQQLNDGLLGYWIEGADGIATSPLHLADIDMVHHEDGSRTVSGQHDHNLHLTLAGPPVTVAMLIDPRAPVHLASGLLPTQVLTVPAGHHRAAMDRLAISFLAAPILTPANAVHVQVPHESGFRWSWIQPVGADWVETSEDDLVAALPAGIDQRQVLRDGWLRLSPTPDTRDGSP